MPLAWSKALLGGDLSRVNVKVIADAVMCGEPLGFDSWRAPFDAEAARALLEQPLPTADER